MERRPCRPPWCSPTFTTSPKRGRPLFSFRPRVTTLNRLLVLLAVTACSGSNEPRPDPGPGRILFTRVGNGLVDIYAMDLNGKHLDQLTTSFALDTWGAWSPDTLKIAFMSDRIPDSSYTARYQIYTMNSDGTNLSQLTSPDPARDSSGRVIDTTSNFYPGWSPDGTKIVFASTRDTNSDIFSMDPNG